MSSPSNTFVNKGTFKGHTASENVLVSELEGTSVGIVVTGDPRGSGGITRFLLNMNLAQTDSEVLQAISKLGGAVKESGMKHRKGWMLTPDTSLNRNAEDKHVAYLQEAAGDLEDSYKFFEDRLQNIVGWGTVVRVTRPFHKVGTLEVNARDEVKVNGHLVQD